MVKYTVWNEKRGATYSELLATEKKTNSNCSSVIKSENDKDFFNVLEAIYNETDIELKYHKLNEV